MVELEKGRNIEERIELYERMNDELEKQVGILERIVKLKDQEIGTLDNTIERYKGLVEVQEKMYQEALRQKEKPLGQKIIDFLVPVSIGIAIGLLL